MYKTDSDIKKKKNYNSNIQRLSNDRIYVKTYAISLITNKFAQDSIKQ
jgi:hypothetical protein